jgi:hypothetical protein
MTTTMQHHLRKIVPALALAVAATACESSVTRPSSTFMAPLASTPASGTTYKYAQQPLTLAITNSTMVTPMTVTYTLEVATDTAFTAKAFTREGIAEGAGGTTSVVLSTLEGAKTYYWRSRATVDGTAGEYSPARSFVLGPRVVVDKPVLSTPGLGDEFYTNPALVTNNATRVGPVTTMQYNFQMSRSSSFATILEQANVTEGSGGKTSWTPTVELSEGPYFWRVRATDLGTGEASPFSDTLRFEKRDGIDFNKVNYIFPFPNISRWEENARIISASHDARGGTLCIDHTRLGIWPGTAFFGDPSVLFEGNQWMFALINGIWYGGAGHWYRPGQSCKGEVDEHFFTDAFSSPPFNTLVLREGDVFGVAVSTPARLWPSMATYDERSNAVLVVW